MKTVNSILILAILALTHLTIAQNVQIEFTNSQNKFKAQPAGKFDTAKSGNAATVNVDISKKYQEIIGFGAALTDSTAYLLYKAPKNIYQELLDKLFSEAKGIGISSIRLPISASDFSLKDYSYDDMPNGKTDPNLEHFTINHDKQYIIPVLRDILKVNPKVKILASPWSPPAWMKTTHSLRGTANGQKSYLIEKYYPTYANFFVRFIKAYEAEGIHINTLTMQNEPGLATTGYPGLVMDSQSQTKFINNFLTPAFLKAGIKTKLLVYDFNWNNVNFPLDVLSHLSADSKKIVAGTAFHGYGGDVSAQSVVHNRFPDMKIHLTENSAGGWKASDFTSTLVSDMEKYLIGAVNNWAETSIKWNLILDQHNGPTHGGCMNCYAFIKLDTSSNKYTLNADYYSFGIFSRFAKQGARSIQTSVTDNKNFMVTGFINPDNSKTVILLNRDSNAHDVNVNFNGKVVHSKVPAKTVAVFKWE